MASSRLERIGTILTRVESLITKGAMRADERPIWYDVYKKFPPFAEPKFARPTPETGPIRPILYEEDVIRAKIHSEGYCLGMVNMNVQEDTQTTKFIQMYKKLQSEGVPESKLIEKSAEAIQAERKTMNKPKMKLKKIEPVTRNLITEGGLKTIFKDQE